MMEKIVLSAEKDVYRIGNTVKRPARPWSKSVFRLMRHFEAENLPVEHIISVDSDFEVSEYVEGERVHPYKWTDDALYTVGELVSQLHKAARIFPENKSDIWQPWYLREIGNGDRICCHGDIAPWNMITQNGYPKVLVDWEYAGMLDPLVELARVCWLFPQLVDDDLQALYNLPSPEKRANQVRIICDGYGLEKSKREQLTEQIIEVIVCETAHEAIDPAITFEDVGCLWGFAWRTRSLYWVWRNKEILRKALQ